jgi:REP element-mobilizing transposase RayT
MPGLQRASAESMTGPPIHIELGHAELLLPQFRETAAYRRWELLAVAIMFNHVHLVVRAPADIKPKKILGDFKAYGSRPLTPRYGKPVSETWWTYGGSKRFLPDDRALAAAIYYVLHKQYNPLLTWSPEQGLRLPPNERGCVRAP